VQDQNVLASYSNGIVVRKTLLPDVKYIAPRLRKADLRELKANSPAKPDVALMTSVWLSNPCYTICVYGEPIGLFGLCPQKDVGVVWMMGTDKVLQIKHTFLKASKEWLNYLLELKPVLFNFIHEKNTIHIKWLRWLGFSIISKKEGFGLNGETFYEFVKIKNNV